MIFYVKNVIIILLLFSFFGFLHTLLASNKVKRILIKQFGLQIAFYRLFYVIIAIIMFYFVYSLSPSSSIIIYDLPHPYDFIILIPQFLSLIGIFWALKYFCVKEFLGINQIKRWINKSYNLNELDEELTLRIEGPYKYCRHPLYLFSILFLIFRSEMNLSYLTFLICIIAYFYIGSFYEERKLEERFGDDYKVYKNVVPRIFPYKFIYPYKPEIDN